MVDKQLFKGPDDWQAEGLLDGLAGVYSIKAEKTYTRSVTYYDTFDWRLFKNSLYLTMQGNTLFLRSLSDNSSQDISAETKAQPVFVEDLPAGALKSRLAPVIKVRALLRLVDIDLQSTIHRILNSDEKTVTRLIIEEMRPSSQIDAPSPALYLHLQPVRGYPKQAKHISQYVEESGLIEAQPEAIYLKALEIVDKKPGDYSAKLDFQLRSEMRSDEAARIILRHLLHVMRRNEAYVIQDVDTEFLHDFRVATRRTRSALSQIKSVFPTEATKRFKQDFAYIGKISNQLRDLDVYLLQEQSYRAMLPIALRYDINPMFDHLRRKRSKALRDVTRALKSKPYKQILDDWEAFLNEAEPEEVDAPNAARPIIDLAQERIYRRYRKVVKSGKRILNNTDDDLLHALRIECKKLRYLMEFFSSLFPPKEIDRLIKQLRNLQNNLGDFNDLCVQEDYLLNIASELPFTDPESRNAFLAVGSLIGTLDIERQRVKNAFAQRFKRFASPANEKLFRQLFKAP